MGNLLGQRGVTQLLAVVVAIGAIGCGDDGSKTDASRATPQEERSEAVRSTPTVDDEATFRALITSSAVVQRAMQPLYLCLPGEISCYKKAAPGVAEVIAQERSSLEPIIDDADSPCIARVAALYAESLAAYEASARAAEDGDDRVVERELARSTRAEKEYVREWSECGFFNAEQAQFITAFGNAFFDVLGASEELVACSTTRCVKRGARKMEAAARAGFELLDDASTEAAEGPECMRKAIESARVTFSAMEKAAISLQEGRYRSAEQQAERGARFGSATQDLFASCGQQLLEE